ncbi:hypothetical protein JCM10450v2_005320 [Rhodotorula kratochvilovae]
MPAANDRVNALLAALEGVRRAWAAGYAPSELLTTFLAETRRLFRTYGGSWPENDCTAVCEELGRFASELRAHPDKYSLEASPARSHPPTFVARGLTLSIQISYNTDLAEEWFPNLNTLWDNSGESVQNRTGGRSLRETVHGGHRAAPLRSRSPRREHDRKPDRERRNYSEERSLPHSARHPEQYKLERLRPF